MTTITLCDWIDFTGLDAALDELRKPLPQPAPVRTPHHTIDANGNWSLVLDNGQYARHVANRKEGLGK